MGLEKGLEILCFILNIILYAGFEFTIENISNNWLNKAKLKPQKL